MQEETKQIFDSLNRTDLVAKRAKVYAELTTETKPLKIIELRKQLKYLNIKINSLT